MLCMESSHVLASFPGFPASFGSLGSLGMRLLMFLRHACQESDVVKATKLHSSWQMVSVLACISMATSRYKSPSHGRIGLKSKPAAGIFSSIQSCTMHRAMYIFHSTPSLPRSGSLHGIEQQAAHLRVLYMHGEHCNQ